MSHCLIHIDRPGHPVIAWSDTPLFFCDYCIERWEAKGIPISRVYLPESGLPTSSVQPAFRFVEASQG